MAGAAMLAPAAAGAAEPSAIEEYVLTLPGVEQSDVQGPSAIEESADRIGEVGVVGEQNDGFTRMGALGAATASPAGVLMLLLAGGGIALALLRRRERS
jgi:hypothetical protein